MAALFILPGAAQSARNRAIYDLAAAAIDIHTAGSFSIVKHRGTSPHQSHEAGTTAALDELPSMLNAMLRANFMDVPPDSPSFYEECVALGVEIANHCSDLYIPVTRETVALLAKFKGKVHYSVFNNNLKDGQPWFDVFFQYEPWWATRAAAPPTSREQVETLRRALCSICTSARLAADHLELGRSLEAGLKLLRTVRDDIATLRHAFVTNGLTP